MVDSSKLKRNKIFKCVEALLHVSHRSWEWSSRNDGNCFNESYPIEHPYWGTGSNLDIMEILIDTLQEAKIDVTLLNITQLSEFRKDAHTSVYTERRGKLLTKEQKSDPITYADCIHWCLPGVPDTWNEILYAYLLYDLGMSWTLFFFFFFKNQNLKYADFFWSFVKYRERDVNINIFVRSFSGNFYCYTELISN